MVVWEQRNYVQVWEELDLRIFLDCSIGEHGVESMGSGENR